MVTGRLREPKMYSKSVLQERSPNASFPKKLLFHIFNLIFCFAPLFAHYPHLHCYFILFCCVCISFTIKQTAWDIENKLEKKWILWSFGWDYWGAWNSISFTCLWRSEQRRVSRSHISDGLQTLHQCRRLYTAGNHSQLLHRLSSFYLISKTWSFMSFRFMLWQQFPPGAWMYAWLIRLY